MLDMIIVSGRMVQVSTTVQSTAIMEPSSHDADPIDAIIRELEPMMAYQRKAMMQAWQDRSVSKLNLVVLMLLENHGPMPMSRLAALVDVSMSNLTGIIDRMEQHALVERVRDDRDRRLVFVRATPRGVERCEEMEGLRREQLRRLLETLDGADHAVVLLAAEALARAVARLDAAEPGAS
jgi:DNA-binding MarR family transcriptional regulator